MKIGQALCHQGDMQINDGGSTGTLGHCWGIQNGTASLRDSRVVSVKLSEALPQSGAIFYLLKELNTFQGSAQVVEACPAPTTP